jgi:hypothetical protein
MLGVASFARKPWMGLFLLVWGSCSSEPIQERGTDVQRFAFKPHYEHLIRGWKGTPVLGELLAHVHAGSSWQHEESKLLREVSVYGMCVGSIKVTADVSEVNEALRALGPLRALDEWKAKSRSLMGSGALAALWLHNASLSEYRPYCGMVPLISNSVTVVSVRWPPPIAGYGECAKAREWPCKLEDTDHMFVVTGSRCVFAVIRKANREESWDRMCVGAIGLLWSKDRSGLSDPPSSAVNWDAWLASDDWLRQWQNAAATVLKEEYGVEFGAAELLDGVLRHSRVVRRPIPSRNGGEVVGLGVIRGTGGRWMLEARGRNEVLGELDLTVYGEGGGSRLSSGALVAGVFGQYIVAIDLGRDVCWQIDLRG